MDFATPSCSGQMMKFKMAPVPSPYARPKVAIENGTEIGKWLYRSRVARGLTQESLAEAADVHVTYVSQIELGKKSPSRKVVTNLARALVPDGLGTEESLEAYKRLLNDGLGAAGFATEDDERRYSSQALSLAELYDGADEAGRRLLDMAREGVARALSRDSVGRNADDFDRREGNGKDGEGK